MKLKHLWGYLILLIIGFSLAGCQPEQPLNQKVTSTDASWYLYQNQAVGPGNLMRLNFYNNETVSVKKISWFNHHSGSNILNADFGNPHYRLNRDGKEITINTTPPRMVLALKKSYQQTLHGYTLKGYLVTYQGETWKLGRITHINHKKARAYQKKRPAHSAIKVASSDKLGPSLMKHVVNPAKAKAEKTVQLAGRSVAGNYNYRALQGNSRVYGHLEIGADGVFTNTLYIHAAQSKANPKVDNPLIMQQQTSSGYLFSLYGKLYLRPLNLLTVKYFTQGQNLDNPAIKAINLATNTAKYGNNIDQSRWRLEWGQKDLLLYTQDLQNFPGADEGNEPTIHLHLTEQTKPQLTQQYQQIYQHYRDLQSQPVASNADLRQYVGAVATKNQSRIAGIGVNMSGKFSINQPAASYAGVDRKGQKQPLMQYLTLIEPAILQEKKDSHTVSTPAGEFLIFGVLNNKLYLLEQPDADSQTVSWAPFHDFPLQLPAAKITWNK